MPQKLIHGILNNDHGSISKAVTIIENNQSSANSILKNIHQYARDSLRIGITGPPGAGKSTITNKLIGLFLKRKKTVGVIAVDPTSPFSGGSLLGDRIRMNKYIWDDRVFVRSMASNGDLGGLARKSQEVGDILAASGKDYIIYETVGVGQSEHEIVKAADLCIVILVPESGDEIQMMKAGLIEIADLFVINKSDRNGANRLSSVLKNVLHHFSQDGKIEPPIFNTIAAENKGIEKFFHGLESHLIDMSKKGYLNDKRLNRYRKRVFNLVRDKLEISFWTNKKIDILEKSTRRIEQITIAPHLLANELLNKTKNES